jgi:hypothetical protein
MNNPDLKSVPVCILNLPNLMFLNLKGSDNVKLPSEITEKAVEMGSGMWDFES